MPHSDAGAVLPRSCNATIMTAYVFDGNLSKLRQFQTAFGLLPVSFATPGLPPSASMTSEVVLSSTMNPTYSKIFGNTTPKKLSWRNFLEGSRVSHHGDIH